MFNEPFHCLLIFKLFNYIIINYKFANNDGYY